MREKVYIDGHVGTTGLRIRTLLAGRDDLEVLTLAEAQRKDQQARREMVDEADVCILCLPDDAAREVAGWCNNNETRLIDASTAHRVNPCWVYGLAELVADQRRQISTARFVSNPGCYASAFIVLLRPVLCKSQECSCYDWRRRRR